MLRRLHLSIPAAGIGVFLLAALFSTTTAHADVSCAPNDPQCTVDVEVPGDDGGNDSSKPKDPDTGFSPGPKKCVDKSGDKPKKIDCKDGDGYWNNRHQCYWQLADEQEDPPPGKSDKGAWYTCKPKDGDDATVVEWRDTPPPGVHTLTPRQAAARLIDTIKFDGINIGMAPRVNPEWDHRRSYVGVPIWMWAKDRTDKNWGPYTYTRTLGGQTITVKAKVTSVLWDMGDGNTEACGNEGTEYNTGYGFTESPTCGHIYRQTSKSKADNRYTVTATSQWQVTWSGGGDSGEASTKATSTEKVEIREAQSVNVSPRN